MKITVTAITPPAGTLDPKKYRRAIRSAQGIAETAALQELRGSVRGWKHRPVFRIARDGDTSTVTTDDPVFIYQDRGTGTHAGRGRYLILPRRKKALKFKNGAIRKRALHPGVPAQDFSGKAAAKFQKQYQRIMQDAIDGARP